MHPNQWFMRFRSAAALAFSVFLLTACAVAPLSPTSDLPSRSTLSAFSLEGRFSLRNEDKSYSGRLSWRHDHLGDQVLLSSPLGQGMAEIVSGPDGARLTANDGRVYAAADAETLTRDVLGYPLPLAQMSDWVRGTLRDAEETVADEFGRPLRQRVAMWRIEYGYDNDDAGAVPNRVFAERVGGGLDLRLRVDEWTRLPSEASKP
jgi:outer membrane lipoprotein LolB